jgi:hypothetical protein
MKLKILKKVLPYMAGVVVLAFVYHYAAELGLLMAHLQANTSPVWPPTGIAIAALLLFGYKYWPGITFGVLLATILKDNPINVSIGLAVGNTLEALVAAYLIKRFLKFHNSLDRIQDVIGFTVCSALATTISASMGVVTLLLTGSEIQNVLWTVWVTWWIGDFGGVGCRSIFADLVYELALSMESKEIFGGSGHTHSPPDGFSICVCKPTGWQSDPRSVDLCDLSFCHVCSPALYSNGSCECSVPCFWSGHIWNCNRVRSIGAEFVE